MTLRLHAVDAGGRIRIVVVWCPRDPPNHHNHNTRLFIEFHLADMDLSFFLVLDVHWNTQPAHTD